MTQPKDNPLRDILKDVNPNHTERTEQEIIDLFIEIVGENETIMKSDYAMGRNELRNEIRTKLNHLRGEV